MQNSVVASWMLFSGGKAGHWGDGIVAKLTLQRLWPLAFFMSLLDTDTRLSIVPGLLLSIYISEKKRGKCVMYWQRPHPHSLCLSNITATYKIYSKMVLCEPVVSL